MWIQIGFSAHSKRNRFHVCMVLVAVFASWFTASSALALIIGGTGNKPITDPGWPAGAAVIFNSESRVAWWEGPPFGGGQWHAECRGDAKALSAVLAGFAKLDVKRKRIVVHDGVGYSFWLNPNRQPDKKEGARIDWVFMVWQRANWDHLRRLPASVNPTGASDADAADGPPAQIDIYTGGNIKWSEVVVPKGIEIADERLEAHGFTLADGIVLEGKSIDLDTNLPLATRVRLDLADGSSVSEKSDTEGHWIIKKAPATWQRIVIEADGYVPRVAAYGQSDEQPGWRSVHCGLAKAVSVAGRVTDESDRPLANVDVRLRDVAGKTGGRYETTGDYGKKTDDQGRFQFDLVPQGAASVWVYKTGYCRPGLGPSIKTPANDLVLKMIKSGQLRITIDFKGKNKPEGYIVEIRAEDGAGAGKWGGSGSIDGQNQISFKDVPPGRYVLVGHPNPSSKDQHTEPLTVDLKGGRITDITLEAK